MVQASSSSPRNRQIIQHLEIQGIPASRCNESTRLLRVRVIRAVGLMKKDIFRSNDPYCKIYLFKNLQSGGMVCPPICTKTIKRSLNPSWNEEIIFRVNPLENRLVFELYDENRLTRDAFLGVVPVSLPHLEIGSEDSDQRIMAKSFLLRPRSPHSRVRGSLHLYFSYLPANTNPRVTTASQLPPSRRAVAPASQVGDPAPAPLADSEFQQHVAIEMAEPYPQTGLTSTGVTISESSAMSAASPNATTAVTVAASELEPNIIGGSVDDSFPSVEVVATPLPPGWDERVDQNNRIYYVDHVNRRTQWDRPSFRLPEGWEQRTDANGRVYYVDHVNRRTTWYHPLSKMTNPGLSTAPRSSAEFRNSSDAEGRNSEGDSDPEDADMDEHNSYSPEHLINSFGPCGSASPALIIADSRGSVRRSVTQARSSETTDPLAASASSAGLRGSIASQSSATAQSANAEVLAARTMYLRRRPVSLEDTLSHPPPPSQSSDLQFDGRAEGATVTPRQEDPGSNLEHPLVALSDTPDATTSAAIPTGSATTENVQSPHLVGPISLGPDEEPLPPGWQLMLTPEGRRLFLNHIKQQTTWDDPRLNQSNVPATSVLKRQTEQHTFEDLGPLPPGWEERVDPKGRIFYIDHNKKATQWEDPRLKRLGLPAVPYSRDFKQKYDYFRSQLRAPRDSQARLELRIRRLHILEDSFRVIHGIKRTECLLHNLWIEFVGEKGLDYGGVQREWFFWLSREMFNPYYGLFEYSAADKYTLQINPLSGLANEDHLKYFKFIGRVVGMAVYHGKLIDGFLIRPFYKMMLGRPITLKDMESVDSEYYRSLKYILENDPSELDLTFSVDEEHFGETTEVDLIPNGRQIRVTNVNKKQYIEHIINWRFASRVKSQMWAFLDGFKDVIDLKTLKLFDANELELLICGLQDISVSDWRTHTLYKGEYHANHPVIINYWKAVYTFTNELRSRLLQFVTGTSRVPMNGFAELWGSSGPQKFTIDCWGSVDQLPRAHTCFNRLDLPPYRTFEELRTKLIIAIENAEGFEGVD